MTELKPCPFCGGEAAVFTYNNEEYDVKCRNSYCLAKSSRWDTEAEAIDAWNTRVERTCEYIGDDISGGCSECRGWLDPTCAYCPSCGAKVVSE